MKAMSGKSELTELMRVVGVSKWEALKGQHVRVISDYSKVYAIGHLLKDEWLDFEKFWAANKKED